MLVTFINPNNDTVSFAFDLSPDVKLEELKLVVGIEMNLEADKIVLFHDGKAMIDLLKSLHDYNVRENDIIAVQSATLPTSNGELEQFRMQLLSNLTLSAQLERTQPDLIAAARENSPRFPALVEGLQRQLAQIHAPESASTVSPSFDPLSVEAQRKIEEIIQQENISANLEHAMEYHPESFGQVTMLYIDCQINGVPLKAFVDCGAQMTISKIFDIGLDAFFTSLYIVMKRFAMKCGLERLIDTRFMGTVKGIGSGNIYGRVHSVPIKIGTQHLPCSLTIIDGDGPDVLFGLDMLRRHQACINLKTGMLEINGEGIGFLAEHEIPKND